MPLDDLIGDVADHFRAVVAYGSVRHSSCIAHRILSLGQAHRWPMATGAGKTVVKRLELEPVAAIYAKS